MIALRTLVDNLATLLRAEATTSLTTVGPVRPLVVADLPAVTLSMTDLHCAKVGVGGNPSNLITGSMQLQLTMDLANPVVVFPDNEAVNLLAADRRSLQIPHRPLVDVDGASPEFLAPGDISVTHNAATFTVVQTPPAAGQCRLTTASGRLEFGAPLAATGSLTVRYRIGQWEAETTRCAGRLQVEVYASGAAATEQLSNEIGTVLSRNPQRIMPGLTRLSALSWGAIDRPVLPKGNTMLRTLQYNFTYDHEQPVIGTGGGPIHIIDVRSAMGPEQFFIT